MTQAELDAMTDAELTARYGTGAEEARFIAALEGGLTKGDVITVPASEARPHIHSDVRRRLGLKAKKAD